jgi:LPS-assembly protein
MARISSVDNFTTANNEGTLQRYPEIIFTGIKQRVFSTPLYLEFEGNYDYFYRGQGQKGHYLDFAPTLSMPFAVSKYAKIVPQIKLRELYWNRDDSRADSENRNGNRTIYNAGVSASSRISRVFNVNIQNWEKLRHEIKPEVFYSYIPEIRQHNLPDYLPRSYTLLDSFLPNDIFYTNALQQQNAVAWALTNTLTARIKSTNGERSYLELLRFKLFQVYDINEYRRDVSGSATENRPLSDLGMELNFAPHPYVSFSARNRYSPYNGWKQMNYDLSLRDWRGDRLIFGYRYTLDSIEEVNADLRAVITDNLTGRLVLRLDRFNNRTVETTVGLFYSKQCWGVGVDYTRSYNDDTVMLKISLAGLGMLGI